MHAYVGRLAINAARRGGSHYHWLSPVIRAFYISFPMLAMLQPFGPTPGPAWRPSSGGRPGRMCATLCPVVKSS